MATRHDGAKHQRRFLTFNQLCERWGNCAHMTVEIRMRKDPRFPRAYVLPGGRIRLFDLDEVEAYERAAVVARHKRAAVVARHKRKAA